MAEAWAEVLSAVIPEQQLEAAYLRAIQDKADNFPLTANDMVAGYRANCVSEKASPRLAQDSNLLTGEVCKKCFGSGFEQYVEKGYKQVRRCDHVDLRECPVCHKYDVLVTNGIWGQHPVPQNGTWSQCVMSGKPVESSDIDVSMF